jgi:glycosyltransferase involved in cell wall biosynthesis
MSLFISVVVCTYNRNQVLCEAIEKLLKQNYSDYELLIIDQSESHDAPTTEYLKSIGDKIRLIKPAFANLPKARNFSLKHTRGEVIVFFDDDMEVPPDTVSKLAEDYVKNPHISIVTGFMSQNYEVDFNKYAGYSWGKPVKANSGLRELEVMDGGFMSFRKEALDRIGDFDEWIGTQMAASGEDHEFSLRARNAGYKIYLDTAITIENRDWTVGGSERAQVDPDFKQIAMTNMKFYINLKNRPYTGLKGWLAANWSLYRFLILNGSIKTNSPTMLLNKHRQFIKSYRWAMNAISRKDVQK